MRQTNPFNALSAMNFFIKTNDKLNKNSGQTVLSNNESVLVSGGTVGAKAPTPAAVAPDLIIGPIRKGNDSQG